MVALLGRMEWQTDATRLFHNYQRVLRLKAKLKHIVTSSKTTKENKRKDSTFKPDGVWSGARGKLVEEILNTG